MIATQSFSGIIEAGNSVKLVNHVYTKCLSSDKQKIGKCIKIEDGTLYIEMKTKKKLEKDVIKSFRKFFESKYPNGECNLYHLQTGIDGEHGSVGKGEAGRPDYEFILNKYPLIAWAIEFKRHQNLADAVNALSANQTAMIGKMNSSGRPTYLVYARGCMEITLNEINQLEDENYQFEAFEKLIERRFYATYIIKERV